MKVKGLIEWLGQFDKECDVYLQDSIDGLWGVSLAVVVDAVEIKHLAPEMMKEEA